ncbi:MAG: alkaline phosphatase, partial [Gammaproteobacteria bacterium]
RFGVNVTHPSQAAEIAAPQQPIKNIILMIGDGMGLAQVNAARWTARQKNQTFNIDTFPVTGLMKTYSRDKLVTDSAASATAMATGYKTNNHMVAVEPDGDPIKTIFEAAHEKGLTTGMVVTSSITHGTPAAFATHVEHREQHTQIATQLIDSDVNVLMGGGWAYFIPSSAKDSRRDDNRDLLAEAQNKGYTVLRHRKELIANKDKKILGLFAEDGLGTSSVEPHITEMTQAALDRLSNNSKGFLLMIEGSQIDWGGHHEDIEEMIEQTLLFDQAVGTALSFAKKNKETLVLVTADHETGGMSILKGKPNGSKLKIKLSTDKHTAIDVPVYAYGPNAHIFTGVYDNTDIAKKIAQLLDLTLD